MRVLLTGNFPVWLATALFLSATALTWRFYRRQSLPPPWRLVLPLTRMSALAILFLSLLQPVVSRQSTNTVRGRLAVVVDDSGSMSIVDTYSPSQRVRTAWQLGLFPREARCVAFESAHSQAAEIGRRVTEWASEIERAFLLPPGEQSSGLSYRRDIHRHTQRTERLARSAREVRAYCEAAVAAADYLSQSADAALPRGHLLYERYENIDGLRLSGLRSAANYPERPDASAMLGSFAMPENVGERYGARVRAILRPPVSGEFIFWLAADDQATLYLSDGPSPAGKREIAHVPQWVPREVFDKYPEQRSSPVGLTKGEDYYIEALLKENLGDDYCTVGWTRPDGRREFPIPGIYFSPVGQTVERQRFATTYNRFMDDLGGEIEQLAALAASIERLFTALGEADVPNPRDEIRRLFAVRSDSWNRLGETLHRLQKQADATLDGAGVESVDTALRKLAGMNRLELVRHLLLKGALKIDKLEELADVDIFFLDEPPQALTANAFATRPLQATRDSTRLGSVIFEIVNHYGGKPVAAVLALTDGNNNAGRSFTEVANFLKERDIRTLCVGVGLIEPPADIAIDNVVAPKTSFKGDRLTFDIRLRRRGYAQRPIRITVTSAGETVLAYTLPPGGEEMVSFDLSFIEARDGYQHYLVEAETMGGEALAGNNRKAVSVNILTDPIRVLLVDQFPRWETRFVRLMLGRDPRVDATVLFTGGAAIANGADGGGWPLSRERLFALDILVLGDVPANFFTSDELLDIRRFVVERGGCLLLLAGAHHLPRTYRQSVLADILPLRVIPQAPLATEASRPPAAGIGLSLTESGKHAAAVQMASTSSENERLWEELPAMNWLVEGILPSPNAEVLVVAGDDRLPTILANHVGLGRVLFLGSDSFWRWRYQTGGRFHQRLWSQIFLWATVGRTTGVDEYVKLMADRAEYSPGETVLLRARVLDGDKLPLDGGVVAANIYNQAGEPVKSVRFTHLPNSGGEYRAQVTGLAKGKYLAVPRVRELEGFVEIKAEYPFEVRDMPTSEYIELALDEGALAILGDYYWHFLEAEKGLAKIPEIQFVETHRRDIEIWNAGWLLLLLAAILGFEWQMRKKLNLG